MLAAVFALLQGPAGGYGLALLQTLLALAAVCILAWVVLRWSARRGFGLGRPGRVRVLERVPLDGRRSLYLVAIGARVLLIGAGEGAAPTLLAELDPDELPPAPERPASLLDLFARARGERPASKAEPE
ncbi:MAG TPA: flagellar biosynthetic protein FliO [Sandaracinaceae bacterium]